MPILVHEQVSDELKNEYREHGVVKIEQVVNTECLEKLSSVADNQLANPGLWVTDTNPGAAEGRLFTSRYRWETDPVINDFVFKSGVGEIAAALMESSSSRFYLLKDHTLGVHIMRRKLLMEKRVGLQSLRVKNVPILRHLEVSMRSSDLM